MADSNYLRSAGAHRGFGDSKLCEKAAKRLLELKQKKTREEIAQMDDQDTLRYIASLGKNKK